MPFKVFYAWQDDRPNNVCRGLIRRALDKAAANLNADLEIEEAHRRVEIDQDTQGVPGSPSVAQTILDKIDACNVFVADLTYITTDYGCRLTPNPNVLIEYGYALKALSDQRLICVLNTAFGSPDDLPFDLQHKRWPIPYTADDGAATDEAKSQRRDARENLAKELETAIRDIIRTFAEDDHPAAPLTPIEAAAPEAQPPGAPPSLPVEEPSALPLSDLPQRRTPAQQYPWDGGLIGMREERKPGEPGYEIHLPDGPSLSLHLKPRAVGKQLSHAETIRLVREALRPMASYRATEWSCVRNWHGAAAFTWLESDPDTAITASLLAHNRELYGIDCYHLQVWRLRDETDDPYIPSGAVEEVMIDALVDFLEMAQNHLDLPPPLELIVGLDAIDGYRLAVDPKHFDDQKIAGRIFYPSIGDTITIDTYECDPFDVLLPLFRKVYDAAGIERPDVRAVGKSQRK